ncbi:ABC transporter permease [Jatrophihabitans endophyticus]|uniref:ABC transporter permease n=1 Tax=Jatrophihabitans endophyticus TaxID=1206085 RepID=UPI0019F2A9E8|nr:ABC transporter permease [Jatrophihabitans endophyticus]MBE7188400.1 ABC transporter permease [Jatrophihabitans endophyticus]
MTFSAVDWPAPAEPRAGAHRDPGAPRGGVLREELAKITRLTRVRALLAAGFLVPFVAAAGFRVQDAVPADSLFGQWVHDSGYALAMVVLGFAAQWVLPAIVALVGGDVFSSEDRYGTWKTILTRSRGRGGIFVGKMLAVLAWVIVSWVVITGGCLLAVFVIGAHPVVGLGGQVVPSGRAAALVTASWALQLPPMVAFAALAIFFSVLSRNSIVGIGAPVAVGLLGQLSTFVDVPTGLRLALPSTAFGAWHGLWVPQTFLAPFWHGLIASVVWTLVALGAAWAVFAYRSIRVSA